MSYRADLHKLDSAGCILTPKTFLFPNMWQFDGHWPMNNSKLGGPTVSIPKSLFPFIYVSQVNWSKLCFSLVLKQAPLYWLSQSASPFASSPPLPPLLPLPLSSSPPSSPWLESSSSSSSASSLFLGLLCGLLDYFLLPESSGKGSLGFGSIIFNKH